MTETMFDTQILVVKSCCTCGMRFAVPESFDRNNKKHGKSWSCPSGHSLVYRETAADELRRDLQWERESHERTRRCEQAASERADKVTRKLTATKGVITRIKRRVGSGVCPCCNRTFKQLAAHMKRLHPKYAKESA